MNHILHEMVIIKGCNIFLTDDTIRTAIITNYNYYIIFNNEYCTDNFVDEVIHCLVIICLKRFFYMPIACFS